MGKKICYFRQKFDHFFDLLISGLYPASRIVYLKVSLMKLQTDIRQWEASENLEMFSGRHNARQNKREQIKLF